MFLEKLEVQGFKSFAQKNQLIFPGMISKDKRGITAVVGPNGSGKSNVADAVRWALGEQSMKTLRGKKSEDVIFSGTEKKGKLGMAEVSLFLNNEDKQAPIDYPEIVLTRRLYRNGDSEYLLNNSRVRLGDIQMLLAKANFGQKTYSVIGQGMVEGFLNTSLAERKEFFDEATGVKKYQIKRDEALNKLRGSYENLQQAEMLTIEIEPRLRSLTRQVNRLRKRDELEKDLKKLQKNYYSVLFNSIDGNFTRYNNEFLELEKEKLAMEKKMEQFTRELEKIKQASQKDDSYISHKQELNELRNSKEELNRQLARLETQKEMKLESLGKFDLSFLIRRQDELKKQIDKIESNLIELSSQKDRLQSGINAYQNDLDRINKKLDQIGSGLSELNKKSEANSTEVELGEIIIKIWNGLAELEETEDVGFIKKSVDRLKKILRPFIQGEAKPQNNQSKWQALQEEQIKINQEKEKLYSEFNKKSLELNSIVERIKMLETQKGEINSELSDIRQKVKPREDEIGDDGLDKEIESLGKEVSAREEKIKKIESIISQEEQAEEEDRNKIFALQKDMQELQNKLNETNNELQNLKISSTRFETKLEDLEVEIREEGFNLKEIKEDPGLEDFKEDKAKAEIQALKKQLELIGGIDPQIEEEYKETKERYDFLDKQINDFKSTVDSLRKIIKELDLTIKEQFDKEFKIIAKKFEEYFKVLFNGGNAKIIKVMDNDSENQDEAEQDKEKKKDEPSSAADLKKIKFLQKHNATGLAGIEIQACPPGKKIKSIAMLSGGERALTAIAMICAIISANPSPFVVLDEVDAALDEANSERLAKILDELSHKTQFIVITHNRASMRRATILYGVTMGDDGISKLLSVKLDEAKAVAR
jgi:chromosome segregation protein